VLWHHKSNTTLQHRDSRNKWWKRFTWRLQEGNQE